jgi:hypothetical protein
MMARGVGRGVTLVDVDRPHAERREDAAPEIGHQRNAGGLLGDQARDDIASVRILPARARRIVERLAGPAVDDAARRDGDGHGGDQIVLRPIVLQARCVAEQLAQRDAVAAADPRKPFCHLVVEAELALVLEQEERHGGELLGVGGDLVGQVGARLRNGRRGAAIGLGEDDPAVTNQRDRGRRDPRLGERAGDQRIDPRLLGGRDGLGKRRLWDADEQGREGTISERLHGGDRNAEFAAVKSQRANPLPRHQSRPRD